MNKKNIFKISKSNLKKTNIRILIIVLIVTFTSILTSILNQNNDIVVTLMAVSITFITIFVAIYYVMKTIKKRFSTYRIILNKDSIIRVNKPLPQVSIMYKDIRSIDKYKNGTTIINGINQNQFIIIPSEIDNHSLLLKKISQLCPIKQKLIDSKKKKYLSYILMALLVISLTSINISENRLILIIAYFIILSVIITSVVSILKNKYYPAKTKIYVLFIIFPIIYYASKVYEKIIN